jgi:hypothetical protein
MDTPLTAIMSEGPRTGNVETGCRTFRYVPLMGHRLARETQADIDDIAYYVFVASGSLEAAGVA